MERSMLLFLLSLVLAGCQFQIKLSSRDDDPTLDSSLRLLNTVSYQDVHYTKDDAIEFEFLDKTVSQVLFSTDENCAIGSWQSYHEKVQYALNGSDLGVQTVYLKAQKADGSETNCHKIRYVKDNLAPSMETISIASDTFWMGVEYVRSGIIIFNATAADSLPIEIKISADHLCGDGLWQELAPSASFASSLQHDQSLRLYAKFRDALGNETSCISSNEVQLDSAGPAVSASSLLVTGLPLADPVEIYDQLVSLSLNATDPLLSEMKISNNADCQGGSYKPYSEHEANWDTGLDVNSSVSVSFIDRLGNTSSCVSLRLKKESGGPTGSLSLFEAIDLNGVDFIPSPNIQLTIAATGTSEMRFFSDRSCSTSVGSWEPLAASKNWNFSAGDGTKEVGVQFRDLTGTKMSSCISAVATLDSVAPTDAQVVPLADYSNEGRFYTASSTLEFLLSADDDSLAFYEVNAAGSCGDGSLKQTIASAHSQSLPVPSGVYVYSFQFFDVFERASSCVTISIIKDTTPGAAPVLAGLLDSAIGDLNQTPRLFLKNDSEIQNATQSGTSHYELRIEKIGTGVVVPWLNVGKKDSFVLSGLQANSDLNLVYQSGFSMIEGADYRMDLRSVDNLGNTSSATSVSFKAKPAPIFVMPLENAATTGLVTRQFKAVGVGLGTPFSVSGGAKVCKQPCDVEAAQNSVVLEEGSDYTVGYTVGSAGTHKMVLTVGSNSDTQSSSAWHISTAKLCPENYVLIPGDTSQRTDSFCLAKFEMKDVGGLAVSQALVEPWTYVDRATADAACAASGGRLPTSGEWNVAALNIAKQDVNWSISNEGQRLRLNTGVSTGSGVYEIPDELEQCFGAGTACGTSWAAHKRTHTLSTGEVIWDFAGNVWEITSSEFSEGIYLSAYWPVVSLDLSSIFSFILVGGQDLRCFQPYNNSYCGMGRAWLNNADVGGQAMYRGGSSNNGGDTGVFTVDFDYDPTHTGPQHGFRCARSLP